MKKLWLLPLAALAIASCSNDEVTNQVVKANQNQLSVRPIMSNTTRGVLTTQSGFNEFTLEINDANSVIGTLAGSTFTPASFTTPLTVQLVGTTWGFNFNSTTNEFGTYYYWKEEATTEPVNFTAFNPSTLTDASTFTVNSTVADQIDPVVAFNSGTKVNNGAAGVPLNFKHILSQIVVKAANKNTNSAVGNRKVEVMAVRLVNVDNAGTVNLPTSSTTTGFSWDNYNPWAALAGNKVEFKAKSAAEALTLTTTAQDISFGQGPFLMMPQALTAHNLKTGVEDNQGAYISVLLRISGDKSSTDDTQVPVFPVGNDADAATIASQGYAYIAVPLTTEAWKPGFKYTYTLNFYDGDNGGAGTTDPNPDTDDEGGDDDPDPGKEVENLPKLLKFTVTVDEWEDAAQDYTF